MSFEFTRCSIIPRICIFSKEKKQTCMKYAIWYMFLNSRKHIVTFKFVRRKIQNIRFVIKFHLATSVFFFQKHQKSFLSICLHTSEPGPYISNKRHVLFSCSGRRYVWISYCIKAIRGSKHPGLVIRGGKSRR